MYKRTKLGHAQIHKHTQPNSCSLSGVQGLSELLAVTDVDVEVVCIVTDQPSGTVVPTGFAEFVYPLERNTNTLHINAARSMFC